MTWRFWPVIMLFFILSCNYVAYGGQFYPFVMALNKYYNDRNSARTTNDKNLGQSSVHFQRFIVNRTDNAQKLLLADNFLRDTMMKFFIHSLGIKMDCSEKLQEKYLHQTDGSYALIEYEVAKDGIFLIDEFLKYEIIFDKLKNQNQLNLELIELIHRIKFRLSLLVKPEIKLKIGRLLLVFLEEEIKRETAINPELSEILKVINSGPTIAKKCYPD